MNARTGSGSTALMYAAAYSKYPSVVRKLLEAGADAALRTDKDRTAGYYIRRNSALKTSDVVRLLPE